MADSISILALGHVFVANMTGNVIFLGFWLAPSTTIDLTAVAVALPTFICTTIVSGRLARHFGIRTRAWITDAYWQPRSCCWWRWRPGGHGNAALPGDNTKLIMIGSPRGDVRAAALELRASSAFRSCPPRC